MLSTEVNDDRLLSALPRGRWACDEFWMD